MRATPLPRDVVPTDAGYDRWAEIYESDGNPLMVLEEPEVVRQLGPTSGLEILDLGCGTGRHALRLAGEGARVTGVDFSEGMLGKARAKPGAGAITFVRHDLATPLPFADASFDRVLSSLVLEHIADLDLLFSEIRRVCRPTGFVLLTAMHPAMMLIGRQACFRDEASGEKVFPRSHPSQISHFVMAALRAGLELDHLGEHPVDEALARACPRAEKYLGWLMLFVMRAHPRG
jgi:ubiquinone/menaquinone biosynthesis C-methylase UbiE